MSHLLKPLVAAVLFVLVFLAAARNLAIEAFDPEFQRGKMTELVGEAAASLADTQEVARSAALAAARAKALAAVSGRMAYYDSAARFRGMLFAAEPPWDPWSSSVVELVETTASSVDVGEFRFYHSAVEWRIPSEKATEIQVRYYQWCRRIDRIATLFELVAAIAAVAMLPLAWHWDLVTRGRRRSIVRRRALRFLGAVLLAWWALCCACAQGGAT